MSRRFAFARLSDRSGFPPIPREFEPVREALVVGRDLSGPCEVLGAALAGDGWTLDEALDGLEVTFRHVEDDAPDLAAVRALLSAWSEATMEFLNGQSCEDPLTGLATLRHLRARLTEIYGAEPAHGISPAASHALVVVEPVAKTRPVRGRGMVDRELRFAAVGHTMRAVYPGSETIGRVGVHRVVAVVRRSEDLGDRVALLRRLLTEEWSASEYGATQPVWIEGLPRNHELAVRLLDELAR
ncbi:MAG: hypothetical protein GEU93_19200 [Propionibacteriales bacterium]|nr:hypothetical protein [Propionibacteriales bacterium]